MNDLNIPKAIKVTQITSAIVCPLVIPPVACMSEWRREIAKMKQVKPRAQPAQRIMVMGLRAGILLDVAICCR